MNKSFVFTLGLSIGISIGCLSPAHSFGSITIVIDPQSLKQIADIASMCTARSSRSLFVSDDDCIKAGRQYSDKMLK